MRFSKGAWWRTLVAVTRVNLQVISLVSPLIALYELVDRVNFREAVPLSLYASMRGEPHVQCMAFGAVLTAHAFLWIKHL